jgi:hypothetical protein
MRTTFTSLSKFSALPTDLVWIANFLIINWTSCWYVDEPYFQIFLTGLAPVINMVPAFRYECRCRRRAADPHEVRCLKWDSVRGENVKTVVYNLRASVPYRNHKQVQGNVLQSL